MTKSSEDNEALFARAAAKGPDAEEAITVFFARMSPTVVKWVSMYIHDAHSAEDVAQEVWMKISQNMDRYTPGTNLMAWMMTITRNTCYDHLRAQQRRPVELLQPDNLQLDQPRPGITPHQYAEQRALAQAVRSHMDKLRPEQAECIRLRFTAGCTPADTAAIMGKTEGAVRTLTVRSLRRLREVLPEGESSTELIEHLLTVAVGRAEDRSTVDGVRVEAARERAPHHVATQR
ncbi:RNA polymerase sigma factor [Streptomyces sp. NPDC088732]|uniref:RNA polymerase sigma factor n=1 Tax=Streptomyces sp. NPDC088732 TaxID=3365879 RepID=UPI00381C6362